MITVKPFDVFIFGDGREFNAGGKHTYRESVFFINPIAILGSLNNYFNDRLNIRFISLEKNGELFFKMPLDIKLSKSEELIKASSEELIKASLYKLNYNFITDEEVEYITDFEFADKMSDVNKYVNQELFKDYLLNKNIKEIPGKSKLKICKELRAGIKINKNTRTTEEGMLYFQSFTRLEENSGFYIVVDRAVESEFLRIGGESKIFKVFKEDEKLSYFESLKENIKKKIEETGFFKIILLTASNGVPNIEGAKLIARIVGKPITFSGWLNLMKSSKYVSPTRIFRLIPEGSVFYYKLEDKNKIDEIVNKFWFKPSFYVKEFPYFDTKNPSGFGISAITFTEIKNGG